MRTLYVFLFSLIFLSCEKNKFIPEDGDNTLIPEDEYNIHGTGKVKTQYNYSSSAAPDPYTFVSYSYDENWNLIKEMVSDYPKPLFAVYTYEYSPGGDLLNKNFFAKEGQSSPDQTEADFELIYTYRYSYTGSNKIETRYIKNILTDSIIYLYNDNLLTTELRYNLVNNTNNTISYEYDRYKNLIKKTDSSDGSYTIYAYEGSLIQNSIQYNVNGTVELSYTYSGTYDSVIVESHYKGPYGDFVFDKSTYIGGNVTEYIKYHPTKPGEWYCSRFEYYP